MIPTHPQLRTLEARTVDSFKALFPLCQSKRTFGRNIEDSPVRSPCDKCSNKVCRPTAGLMQAPWYFLTKKTVAAGETRISRNWLRHVCWLPWRCYRTPAINQRFGRRRTTGPCPRKYLAINPAKHSEALPGELGGDVAGVPGAGSRRGSDQEKRKPPGSKKTQGSQ